MTGAASPTPSRGRAAMKKLRWTSALALIVLLGQAGAAAAQKSADTLRIVWRDSIPNVDPYYNQLRVGVIFHMHVWDTLLYRDPKSFELKPLLATSWRWVDPTTLDVQLREGVRFHN